MLTLFIIKMRKTSCGKSLTWVFLEWYPSLRASEKWVSWFKTNSILHLHSAADGALRLNAPITAPSTRTALIGSERICMLSSQTLRALGMTSFLITSHTGWPPTPALSKSEVSLQPCTCARPDLTGLRASRRTPALIGGRLLPPSPSFSSPPSPLPRRCLLHATGGVSIGECAQIASLGGDGKGGGVGRRRTSEVEERICVYRWLDGSAEENVAGCRRGGGGRRRERGCCAKGTFYSVVFFYFI